MIKPRTSNSHRRRHHTGHARSFLQDIVSPLRYGHEANFKRILPSAMAKLVDEGLFVADASVEGGYRITDLGKARLRALEEK